MLREAACGLGCLAGEGKLGTGMEERVGVEKILTWTQVPAAAVLSLMMPVNDVCVQ